MAEALLKVEGLCRSFEQHKAVDGVDFEVYEGECLGLLGPNGAGKTTTVEMLEGLNPPDSGRILFRGAPVDASYKQQIGIQFQQTALPDYLKVKEVLHLFSTFYEKTLPIEQTIALCQLEELLDRDHRKLSGGQRQRLLLALALLNDPQLVFLDEPTTGLDPAARRHFWSLVTDLKAAGKTLLLTTHYMDEAETLCDRVLIMDRGKIITGGTPADLLAQHFSGNVVKLRSNEHINQCQGLKKLRKNGEWMEFISDDVSADIQQLTLAGVPLDALTVHAATLEDLFIHLTGHKLRG